MDNVGEAVNVCNLERQLVRKSGLPFRGSTSYGETTLLIALDGDDASFK